MKKLYTTKYEEDKVHLNLNSRVYWIHCFSSAWHVDFEVLGNCLHLFCYFLFTYEVFCCWISQGALSQPSFSTAKCQQFTESNFFMVRVFSQDFNCFDCNTSSALFASCVSCYIQ